MVPSWAVRFWRQIATDQPWSEGRSRVTLFWMLPAFGMIGGALQGKILYLAVEVPRGDIIVWSLMEYFAWLGWAIGLAVGLSMSMTRHVLGRLLLAPLCGAVLVTAVVGVYSGSSPVSLLGTSLEGVSAGLIERPEGWGLFLGGPTALAVTIACHLARRALAVPWTLLSIPAIGGLLCHRADSLMWDALWPSLSSRVPCGNGLRFDRSLVDPHLYGAMVLMMLIVTGGILAETAASFSFRFATVFVRRAFPAVSNAALILGLLWGATLLPFAAPSAVSALAFSPDEEFLVSAHEGGTLRLWKFRDGEEATLEEVDRVRLFRGPLRPVKFAVSSGMVAAWRNEGQVEIWQVAPFKHLLDLEIPISDEIDFAISPDGRSLLMSRAGFQLCLWNFQYQPEGTLSAVKKSLQGGIPTPSNAYTENTWTTPRFAANSEWIVRPLSGFIEYIDRPTGRPRQYSLLKQDVGPQPYLYPWLAAFSPDGAAIAAQNDQGEILILRLPSGQVERLSRDSHLRLNAMAISPDGSELTITDSYQVRRWELNPLRLRRDWMPPDSNRRVLCLEYSPSGRQLALGLENGTIEIEASASSTTAETDGRPAIR